MGGSFTCTPVQWLAVCAAREQVKTVGG
jgi:hypothetical protein